LGARAFDYVGTLYFYGAKDAARVQVRERIEKSNNKQITFFVPRLLLLLNAADPFLPEEPPLLFLLASLPILRLGCVIRFNVAHHFT
jgi:hypothetical protein